MGRVPGTGGQRVWKGWSEGRRCLEPLRVQQPFFQWPGLFQYRRRSGGFHLCLGAAIRQELKIMDHRGLPFRRIAQDAGGRAAT